MKSNEYLIEKLTGVPENIMDICTKIIGILIIDSKKSKRRKPEEKSPYEGMTYSAIMKKIKEEIPDLKESDYLGAIRQLINSGHIRCRGKDKDKKLENSHYFPAVHLIR
ncbi:MAG: hypothetical protein QW727_02760 [Candidatus Pacearchaeota archaeon]